MLPVNLHTPNLGVQKLMSWGVDNPYQAAQEFIWKNELPQDYLDQIANFIMQNAQGATLGAGPSNLQDPFTGMDHVLAQE